MIKFYKYHSNGNDFILIDNINKEYNNFKKEDIKKLCSRNFGIGADGVIILKSCKKYNFEILYYNSDGSISLCCNGSRCAIDFAIEKGYFHKEKAGEVLAFDGPHKVFIKNNEIFFFMKNIKKIEKYDKDFFINTGAPHYIKFVNTLDKDIIKKYVTDIKKNFYLNTNITFIKKKDIRIPIEATTYEKGVEKETLSCGTGAVAAAIASNEIHNLSSPIEINMKGGQFRVCFDKIEKIFTNIYISGKTKKVFQGYVDLKKL